MRNIGLIDGLSGSDRVCYKGRPGPVERPSEVMCRVWVRGEGGGGEGRRWGERRWEMEIPVIRMCDGDMYPSYEGWYGVGGDVHATGGAPERGGGGG